MTGAVCAFDDCDRPARTHRLCKCHVNQWYRRERDMSKLTPIRPARRRYDCAVADIEEFEWLLTSGETIPNAVARMGMCGRSLTRRYQLIDRPIPPGMWTYS